MTSVVNVAGRTTGRTITTVASSGEVPTTSALTTLGPSTWLVEDLGGRTRRPRLRSEARRGGQGTSHRSRPACGNVTRDCWDSQGAVKEPKRHCTHHRSNDYRHSTETAPPAAHGQRHTKPYGGDDCSEHTDPQPRVESGGEDLPKLLPARPWPLSDRAERVVQRHQPQRCPERADPRNPNGAAAEAMAVNDSQHPYSQEGSPDDPDCCEGDEGCWHTVSIAPNSPAVPANRVRPKAQPVPSGTAISSDYGERPHREGPHALEPRWHREESESGRGQGFQVLEVLDDGDSGCE